MESEGRGPAVVSVYLSVGLPPWLPAVLPAGPPPLPARAFLVWSGLARPGLAWPGKSGLVWSLNIGGKTPYSVSTFGSNMRPVLHLVVQHYRDYRTTIGSSYGLGHASVSVK